MLEKKSIGSSAACNLCTATAKWTLSFGLLALFTKCFYDYQKKSFKKVKHCKKTHPWSLTGRPDDQGACSCQSSKSSLTLRCVVHSSSEASLSWWRMSLFILYALSSLWPVRNREWWFAHQDRPTVNQSSRNVFAVFFICTLCRRPRRAKERVKMKRRRYHLTSSSVNATIVNEIFLFPSEFFNRRSSHPSHSPIVALRYSEVTKSTRTPVDGHVCERSHVAPKQNCIFQFS